MHSLFRVSWGYMIQWWSKLDWQPRGRATTGHTAHEDQRAPILLANNPHFRVSFGSLTVKANCLQTDRPHGEVWMGIVQKTAVYKYFTQITNCWHQKNINHIMYEYCFLSFYIDLVQCITYQFLLGRRTQSWDWHCWGNVNNPFGPKAENSREKQYLEKGNKKQRPPKDHWNILFVTFRKCDIGIIK